MVRIQRLCALVTLSLLATELFGAAVATLGGRGDHDDEFKDALTRLNVASDHYRCNAQEMKRLSENLNRYDIVLACPLFNYAGSKTILKPEETDFTAWREWLKAGGCLVFAEGNYQPVREWLELLDPSFGGLETEKCTSSQWAVLGHSTNEMPLDPLRSFPNLLSEGDSWPHIKSIADGSKWRVLARCSEGYPNTILQEYGKGVVILSTLRLSSWDVIENYLVNARIRRLGLQIEQAKVPALALGSHQLIIKWKDKLPQGATLIYAITSNQMTRQGVRPVTQRLSAPLTAETTIDYSIKARGEVSAELILKKSETEHVLLTRRGRMPQVIEVESADYRGILSTARRSDTVPFQLHFTPLKENVDNRTLQLRLYDSCSNCVSKWSHTFSRATPPFNSTNITVNLEVPKELTPGKYELRASYWQAWRCFASHEQPLEILAPNPAQTVVDIDRTFLVNGKPFFPLGIYHTNGEYQRIAEIGFNTIQFWKWESRTDSYGRETGLSKAVGEGLHLLFESNHHGEKVFRTCVQNYGRQPGVLMWYVADEPGNAAELLLSQRQRWWHDADNQHPTFLASCREDLFDIHQRYTDVFAFDPYGSKETPFDAVEKTVRWFRKAKQATNGRKPLVCVPHAFPSAKGVLRAVAYVSLVHDARGIIWYCWKQTGGGPVGVGLHQYPERQEEHKELLAEIKAMCKNGGLLSPRRRCFEAGAIHGIVCGDARKGDRFILLVNTSDKTATASLEIPELKGRKELKEPFNSNKAHSLTGDNKISVELPPYATCVYQF